jgi:hypothetical protein
MIIAQAVISVLIRRPGIAPKPLSFQDVCILRPGRTLRRTLSLVIYRVFSLLPQCFLQSPPWGDIIFNQVKHFPHSFALST